MGSPAAALVDASPAPLGRAELFRLLGDEHRLRLLALCAEEELTVGELATLLKESQPQLTKKSQPLREAQLLSARKDGTRTLLKTVVSDDHVVAAALEAGRALCAQDGSLARIAGVVAQREELSRRAFDAATEEPIVVEGGRVLPVLPVLRALLPGRALAVDVGTGDGALLPLLSPLYERVVAVDRSAARLARCAAHVGALGLGNVRLRECDVDDAGLAQEIAERGGADLVIMARVLQHLARPEDAVVAAARMLKVGGHLVIVDGLPHDQEAMREQGVVWLGFEPARLATFLASASLSPVSSYRLDQTTPSLQVAVGRRDA